jgi:hypothetical protein
MNWRLIGFFFVLASVLLVPAAFGQTRTNSGPMSVVGRVEGHRGGYYTVHPASYTLRSGRLTPQSLSVRLATFDQTGGTNRVAEDLQVRQGWYNDYTVYRLSGGRLATSNSSAHASGYSPGIRGFWQVGGTHVVRGTLGLGGSFSHPYGGGYHFGGGALIVRDILIGGGAIFLQGSGKLTHGGMMTLAGGHWKLAASASRTQPLGPLQLTAAQTDSSFTFAEGTLAIVRFAPSATIAWDAEARLMIQHWQGQPTGRGLHQLYFGRNGAGLTPQQLSQIRFHNPKGFPPGEYLAQQRATGEIVPTVSILTDSIPVFRR